jgi:hypothetical protein
MKSLYTILIIIALSVASTSCGDEDISLPSDYMSASLSPEAIHEFLPGTWTRLTVTRASYSNGQEYIQQEGVVDAPFTFQVPQADGVVDFMSQNFPNLYRTYEVRFFGESFSFYDRQYDQGQSMTLSKLTANEAVFSIYETPFEGYYSVLNYTLTR